jgi:hypothetical protein
VQNRSKSSGTCGSVSCWPKDKGRGTKCQQVLAVSVQEAPREQWSFFPKLTHRIRCQRDGARDGISARAFSDRTADFGKQMPTNEREKSKNDIEMLETSRGGRGAAAIG